MAQIISATIHAITSLFPSPRTKRTSKELEHTQVARTTAERHGPRAEHTAVPSIHSRSAISEPPSPLAEIGRTSRGPPLCIPTRVLDTPSGNCLGLSPHQNGTTGRSYHYGRPKLHQGAYWPGSSTQPTQYGPNERECGLTEFPKSGIRNHETLISKFRLQHQLIPKFEKQLRQTERKLHSAQGEILQLQARLEGFTELPVPPIPVIADQDTQSHESVHDDLYYSMRFVELRTKIREWVVQSFFTRGSNPVDSLPKLDERELLSLGIAEVHPSPYLLENSVPVCGPASGPCLPDSKTLRYLIQAYVATILHKHVLGPFLPGMPESIIDNLMGEWMDDCNFRDRATWKLRTLRLITNSPSYAKKVTQMTQRLTLDIVRCLAPLGKHPFNIEGRARALGKIFSTAASLVLELRQEPYDFRVPHFGRGTCCTGMPVSDAEGKISDEDLQHLKGGNEFILQLVIFPPLVRAASQDLDEAVLATAHVLVEEALL